MLAASWAVVAFLLLRMAYGGSIGGILYVLRVNHPAILVIGALTIMGAASIAFLALRGMSPRALPLSIGLSLVALPLSIVLATQDHGSAPAIAVAATLAMIISVRAALRPAPGA